jgi:hypothetical protein
MAVEQEVERLRAKLADDFVSIRRAQFLAILI